MAVRLSEKFEDGLGYLVHHLLYAFRQGWSRECARTGYRVTPEEMAVMALLRHEDGLRQTELSAKLAKDKAVITRTLTRLDGEGLVERRHDPADRRVVRAFLTDDGRRALEALFPLLMDYLRRTLHDISQEDFDITCRVLRRIITNLSSEGGRSEGGR